MGGRFGPESVAGFDRKGWPVYAGISGRFGPEYAYYRWIPKDAGDAGQKVMKQWGSRTNR